MAVYYCDQSIGTASGSGTIGDPWGTIDHALASITRTASATGDALHVRGDSVRSTSLTLPSGSTRFVIRGYNAAAGDLIFDPWSPITLPEIDFGSAAVMAGTPAKVTFANLRIATTGNFYLSSNYNNVVRCDISCSRLLVGGFSPIVRQCKIRGLATGVVLGYSHVEVIANDIVTSSGYGIYLNGGGGNVIRNRVTATTEAVYVNGASVPAKIHHNSLKGATGIRVVSCGGSLIIGNAIDATTAISETGSVESLGEVSGNRWYATTGLSASNTPEIEDDNASLIAAPFTDPANGDWTPSDELAAIVGTDGLTPGAIQATATGGGVAAVHPLSSRSSHPVN
jgi:hypothetical protein